MFFFRNLLFLVSLAFISWAVLCYLNKINESRELPHRLDFALEKSLNDILTSQTRPYRGYQTYINFLCIFTCIYVLAKFIEMIESICVPNLRAVLGRFRRSKERAEDGSSNGERYGQHANLESDLALDMHEATFTIDDYRKMSKSLREEIAKMWKRNEYLDQRVRELEQHNLLLMGKGLLQAREAGVGFQENGIVVISSKGGCDGETLVRNTCDTELDIDPYFYVLEGGNGGTGISVGCANIVCTYFCDNDSKEDAAGADGDKKDVCSEFQNGQIVRVVPKRGRRFPFQRNIFIANRFFHMNRQVYVNEGSVKLSFQSRNGGDFTHVWQKYLKMQRLYHGMSTKEFEPLSIPTRNVPPTIIDENDIDIEIPPKNIDLSKIEIDFSAKIPTVLAEGHETVIEPKPTVDEELCNPTPIVVTTAELETMQGLGQPKKAVLSGQIPL